MYVIFNDQSFNDTLTNDIVSFEQLGPEVFGSSAGCTRDWFNLVQLWQGVMMSQYLG